ncbi:dihydrofolate reductase [Malonomonas rubra]|uniref:dihydrofolate reductase n=1 Tax=Malonomonas rubra TaxID=57040 RepID=UPI0026EF405F|nr:dihydrofolate reductase [Malonomonas rubra]
MLLIALIAAMAQNRVIGRDGKLPWQLPGDLQRFKYVTMGQTLLMGRKTYQSIGRPLPGRKTIILSRNPAFSAPACLIVNSLAAGLAAAQTERLFICGGEAIYNQALPLAEKIYLTELLHEVAGDTFFPELPACQFQEIYSEEYSDDGQPCRFNILQRVGAAKAEQITPEKGLS